MSNYPDEEWQTQLDAESTIILSERECCEECNGDGEVECGACHGTGQAPREPSNEITLEESFRGVCGERDHYRATLIQIRSLLTALVMEEPSDRRVHDCIRRAQGAITPSPQFPKNGKRITACDHSIFFDFPCGKYKCASCKQEVVVACGEIGCAKCRKASDSLAVADSVAMAPDSADAPGVLGEARSCDGREREQERNLER